LSRPFTEILLLPEFEKDKKKLLKRFRTLDDDLHTFIDVQLKSFHKLKIDNSGIEHISDLGITYPQLFKVVKFACRSLKGRGVQSGIRIIYSFFDDKDKIEFIEIYFKGDKDNEDRERIKKYYQ